MTSITKATVSDFKILARLSKRTFIESHGHSAPSRDIESYIAAKYTDEQWQAELKNPKNTYNIIYHDDVPVGYSNIVMSVSASNIPMSDITMLDRIYVLKDYYDLKLGQQLLNHNIELSKKQHQQGMWLYVWTENTRAVKFYTKNGFQIVGNHYFKISETHSNPNFQMFLAY